MSRRMYFSNARLSQVVAYGAGDIGHRTAKVEQLEPVVDLTR